MHKDNDRFSIVGIMMLAICAVWPSSSFPKTDPDAECRHRTDYQELLNWRTEVGQIRNLLPRIKANVSDGYKIKKDDKSRAAIEFGIILGKIEGLWHVSSHLLCSEASEHIANTLVLQVAALLSYFLPESNGCPDRLYWLDLICSRGKGGALVIQTHCATHNAWEEITAVREGDRSTALRRLQEATENASQLYVQYTSCL